VCVRDESLMNIVSKDILHICRQNSRIQNSEALWDKDKHIKFWGQGSRLQWGQIFPKMHCLACHMLAEA